MDSIRLDMIIVTIYCYLEKRNLQSFEVSYETSLLLWNMGLRLLSAALQ